MQSPHVWADFPGSLHQHCGAAPLESKTVKPSRQIVEPYLAATLHWYSSWRRRRRKIDCGKRRGNDVVVVLPWEMRRRGGLLVAAAAAVCHALPASVGPREAADCSAKCGTSPLLLTMLRKVLPLIPDSGARCNML